MKPYDLGIMCGRFQHMHIGHENVVDTGFRLCNRILILVGSSQEKYTKRNPFDYDFRKKIIKSIYSDEFCVGNLIIVPLPDMTTDPEDISPDWGRYVLNIVKQEVGKLPDIMIYGNDEARSSWFDREDIKNMMEVIVPRSRINISATQMRQYLMDNNFESWKQYVNPKIVNKFNEIRNYLLDIEYYKL